MEDLRTWWKNLVGDWDRPYSREQACFPPGVFRVDKWRPQPDLHLPAGGKLRRGG
ncbi:hypothetical protein [Rhizobium ruizarguesonis]|uniref:hypothetical protein n=1 Tax=Rhizobium ruizarguesonis TaxID=2081791 RepID=UPI0013EE59DC|nr:hypothetical protein [Rhizobium ruizarguesonis]